MRNRIVNFVFLGVAILTAAVPMSAQYKGSPVKKDKLLSVIRSHQLQTREIVSTINSNGVDFKVDAIVEAELRGAGARPEVIDAARNNYRAAVAPVANTPAKGTPKNVNSSGKAYNGTPMSKDVIITLLNNGVADTQVRNNVNTRGISFKPTAEDKAEIKAAGGSPALVAMLDKSYNNPNENSIVANDIGGGTGQYDALVDKAVYQYDVAKDVNGSIASLTQAIALNPAEARGYQLMGFSYLYGLKNFAEAEKYMQMAIDRGGSAVFRVFHDHGLQMDSCEGSLFVAKDTVRFESDNNVHTFQTQDTNIKEAKMAGKFAAMFNARSGLFKISLKTGDNESKNYNFSPLTNDSAESKMIIRLIDKKKT
jgi:hypothetical protein